MRSFALREFFIRINKLKYLNSCRDELLLRQNPNIELDNDSNGVIFTFANYLPFSEIVSIPRKEFRKKRSI